jgi:Putative porin
MSLWLLIFGTICLLGPTSRGFSEDTSDPILDLMLEKGMITEAEAAKVKAEAEAIRTNEISQLPESKWKIGDGIKSLELFGDVRLRYEDREAQDPSAGKGSKIGKIDLQRYRYSLRFGLRGEAFDDFYYGFRLETSSNPRSSWVTLGTSASGSSVYQGPFGKSNDTLDIGQAYLGWRPENWIDLTVGKMPNPLYTTPMVWDGDLNPEGAAEHFKYTVGDADLFANFGQFLYADFNPSSASGGLGINGLIGQNTDNIFMFAWQGGLNYHITQNTSAKIAATLYNYIGLQRSSANSGSSLAPYFGDPYVGEGAYYYYGGLSPNTATGVAGYSPGTTFNLPSGGYGSVDYPFNQVGLNDLLVLEVPFEFNFKISKFAVRAFGDVAYNLEGAQRAEAAAAANSHILSLNPSGSAIPHSFPAQTHDVKAYQFGLAIGSKDGLGLVSGATPKKHSWEFRTYWQHIEQYALDPNIIDSDVFEGRENMQGINLQFAYAFTDNFIGMARYTQASRINDKLGTGGDNEDIPQMNPINNFQMFQIDLDFKF